MIHLSNFDTIKDFTAVTVQCGRTLKPGTREFYIIPSHVPNFTQEWMSHYGALCPECFTPLQILAMCNL